jgi:hypothetical protein
VPPRGKDRITDGILHRCVWALLPTNSRAWQRCAWPKDLTGAHRIRHYGAFVACLALENPVKRRRDGDEERRRGKTGVRATGHGWGGDAGEYQRRGAQKTLRVTSALRPACGGIAGAPGGDRLALSAILRPACPRWLPRQDTVTSVLSSHPTEAVGGKGDGVAKGHCLLLYSPGAQTVGHFPSIALSQVHRKCTTQALGPDPYAETYRPVRVKVKGEAPQGRPPPRQRV